MVVALDIILVVGSLLMSSGEALEQREIHLAGIFPINGVEGWQGGQACEPAADLALQDVNAQSDILPGYTLKLHWDDSGVSVISFERSRIIINIAARYAVPCHAAP